MGFERADEEGVEGGGGLPDPGRRLGEEVLALRGGAGGGDGHLPLPGAVVRVREREGLRLGGLRLGEGLLLEERVEEEARAPHEVVERLLGLVGDVEELRRARLDVREDEAAAHGPALGGRDRLHVPAELELEALEARGARQLREVLGEVEGLDLVDDDAARPPRSGRRGGPRARP